MKDLYVFHVSDKRLKDVRPLALQKGNTRHKREVKELIGEARYETYQYEINAFLEPPKQSDIDRLVSAGFTAWANNGLFIYKINLDDNIDNILSIRITSHPEQHKFMDKYWSKWYEKHKHLNNDEFYKAKKELIKQMSIETGIPYQMSLEEFKILASEKDWYGFSEFVTLNIEKGSKRQYATYIPHVQITVKKPLTIEKVTEITGVSRKIYHASPINNLKIIKKNKTSLDKRECVFGTYNKSYVAIFCCMWDDSMLNVKTVDNETFITEVYPGAINEVYKGKTGYIYELDEDGFTQTLNVQGQELIAFSDKKVINKQVVNDVLKRLEKDPLIHLIKIN